MENKANRAIVLWLITGAFLVASMVVIGGITRLTQSGLSMVEWKLIMGAVPPMNEQAWQATFEKYKQFPEYQKLNIHYTLSDFKSIFWWEYIHRLLGRVMGIVFIIPFFYFLMRKQLSKALVKKLILILALGAFQGFLGWFMVKSGLVNNPHVSHYRLAAHLVTAFALFGIIMDLAFKIGWPVANKVYAVYYRPILRTLLVLISLQIIFGAFVAGLKAGLFYSTFPTMNGEWMPRVIQESVRENGWISWIDTVAGVQYIHRWLGIIVWTYTLMISVVFYSSLTDNQRKGFMLLFGMITLQALLGIFTLLYSVPIVMAVLHQLGALLTILAWVYAMHTTRLAISLKR